jgi:hypothetical protein
MGHGVSPPEIDRQSGFGGAIVEAGARRGRLLVTGTGVLIEVDGWTELRLLHWARMFIHRTMITGCSDRGAWPWRKPVEVRT